MQKDTVLRAPSVPAGDGTPCSYLCEVVVRARFPSLPFHRAWARPCSPSPMAWLSKRTSVSPVPEPARTNPWVSPAPTPPPLDLYLPGAN